MSEVEVANPAVGYITAPDTKEWSKTRVAAGASNVGIQMAVYRGELYGIVTGLNHRLYATKYHARTAWKPYRILPERFKALGRVSVTTLGDSFYVAYRGINDAVYLIWTENFTDWTDVGELSPGGRTMAPPAIAGYDGNIHAICTGYGKDVHWAISQGRTNKLLQSWKSLGADDKSDHALELVVHHNALYMFYTRLDKQAINTRVIETGQTSWQPIRALEASIISGPSAVSFKSDRILISYIDSSHTVTRVTVNSAIQSIDRMKLNGRKAVSATGTGTYMGLVFITYGVVPGRNAVLDEPLHTRMKMTYSHVEEVEDEWDCKWNEEQPKSKSVFRKLLCM